jgi:hypothetical protein
MPCVTASLGFPTMGEVEEKLSPRIGGFRETLSEYAGEKGRIPLKGLRSPIRIGLPGGERRLS